MCFDPSTAGRPFVVATGRAVSRERVMVTQVDRKGHTLTRAVRDMELRVRPFHPHDYPRVARIKCEAEGERVSENDIRRYDEQWDHSRFEKVRVVAQDEEGVAIGYGELHHEPDAFDPRRYFLHLAVDPLYRRRGVATAIWEHIREELAERDATLVRLRTDPLGPGATWAERKGFRWVGEDRPTGLALYELRP